MINFCIIVHLPILPYWWKHGLQIIHSVIIQNLWQGGWIKLNTHELIENNYVMKYFLKEIIFLACHHLFFPCVSWLLSRKPQGLICNLDHYLKLHFCLPFLPNVTIQCFILWTAPDASSKRFHVYSGHPRDAKTS